MPVATVVGAHAALALVVAARQGRQLRSVQAQRSVGRCSAAAWSNGVARGVLRHQLQQQAGSRYKAGRSRFNAKQSVREHSRRPMRTYCVQEPPTEFDTADEKQNRGIDITNYSPEDLAKIQELIEQEAEFQEGKAGEPPIPSFRKEDLGKEVGSTGHTLYEWLQYWQVSAKAGEGEEWVEWVEVFDS